MTFASEQLITLDIRVFEYKITLVSKQAYKRFVSLSEAALTHRRRLGDVTRIFRLGGLKP